MRTSGRAYQDSRGWHVDSAFEGPFQLAGNVSGLVTGAAPSLRYDLELPDIGALVPQLSGSTRLRGTAAQDADGWTVDTNISGPYALDANVAGRVTGSNPSVRYDAALPDINPLVPQFRGAARLSGTASQSGDDWGVDTVLDGPYGIAATVAGSLSGTAPRVRYTLRIPDIAPLGAGISGPLNLEGSAEQIASAWQIDTALAGLSGTNAQLRGLVRENGTLVMTATGSAPLGLANPFLAPQNISGQAQFDLAVNGAPSLGAVSGSVTTTGARLSAPSLQLALNNIGARIDLAAGRAQVAMAAAVSSGGRITLDGPVSLDDNLAADLALALLSVELSDPALYQTTLNGQLRVNGPLAGGASIAGDIEIGETNVQIPSSQATGFSIVPQIAHVNASPAVRKTLAQAGLNQTDTASATRAAGPSYPLNIRVNAPSRIFVRGRGLDAELGGALTIGGRTDQIVSAGQFELIRGRVDLLGKRFTLDEGSVLLQGQLDPFLRFVATTPTSAGTASITIEGLASEPSVSFSASPDAPEDEVLAQIFFGRDASQLSAFQAIQLANAVANLAGKGGEGLTSRLRKSFGLDDFNIATDADGNTGLQLGKYISDNVYTDVTVGNADTAGVSINIDLTPNLTLRGQTRTDRTSSVGIFFERDY